MKSKKWIMAMLVVLLALTGIAPMASAMPHPDSFLGTDASTQGNWIGNYGGDGYILVGYNKAPNGALQGAAPADNAVDLPSYVTSYFFNIGGLATVWPTYDTDPRILEPLPPATQKLRSEAMGYFDKTYTFTLNDSAEHQFSFYSMNNAANTTITLKDAGGNVLDVRSFPKSAYDNGLYVTYKVKGSFQLLVTSDAVKWGPSGFFFDTLHSDKPAGLTATTSGRNITLNWSNPGSFDQILVERSADDTQYGIIDTIDGSSVSYTDEDLPSSSTFYYRLRYKDGTGYGESTAVTSASTVDYTDTELTFPNGDIAATAGETLSLQALFESVDGGVRTPHAGRTIQFRLEGPYVGSGVPEDIGTAVTDSSGIATLSYDAVYGGVYTVVAYSAADEVDGLDQAQAGMTLTVNAAAWEEPPIIFRASEAVGPGELLSLYGGGMLERDTSVWIQPLTGTSIPSSPSSSAIEVTPEQTEADGDRFARIVVPGELAAGMYAVWGENGYGLSDTVVVNGADPKWLSDEEAFDGLTVKLFGRNLDAAEFGGATASQIRLVDTATSSVVPATVTNVTYYALDFEVGNAPEGVYEVQVRNAANVPWKSLADEPLTVVDPGSNPDPLSLDVSWAKDFNWARQADVQADYGAAGDGLADDTAAIQEGIDDLADNGGGVLYFPSGTYDINTIQMRKGVVLEGEDPSSTELHYIGSGGTVIGSKGDGSTDGLMGFANLKITVEESHLTGPLSTFVLGNGWAEPNLTASRMFFYKINIDMPLDNKNIHIAALIGALENVLFLDNYFKGYANSIYSPYIKRHLTLRGNTIEHADNSAVNAGSQRMIWEDNHVIGHFIPFVTTGNFRGLKYDVGSRGWNTDHIYMKGNIIEGVGSDESSAQGNDGETLMMETGFSNFGRGFVLAATSTTADLGSIYVEPTMNWSMTWNIVIVGGKGLGQQRLVTGHDGITVTVDRPWDIVPDQTSQFAIERTTNDVVIAGNTTLDSRGTISLYHNTMDAVIADNVTDGTQGISVLGRSYEGTFVEPSYFTQVKRNKTSGASWKFLTNSIFISAAQEQGLSSEADVVTVYGAELKQNVVDRTGSGNIGTLNGVPAAIPIGYRSPRPATGKGILGVMLEENELTGSNVGIYLSPGVDSTLLRGNSFDGVDEAVQDHATNTVTAQVPETIAVTNIAVTGENGVSTIAGLGGTLQMSATVTPGNATDKSVDWTVVAENGAATNAATIDDNGLLTALANGKVKVVATAKDGSGVQAESVVLIDSTPPAIVTPSKLTFLQTEPILVNFSATDNVSGLQSLAVTFNGQTSAGQIALDPFALNVGSYPIAVTATDNAGHQSTEQFSLVITIDIGHLDDLIAYGFDRGWIDNDETENGLMSHANQIQRDQGDDKKLQNSINSMENELGAQRGKHIDEPFADLILEDLALIENTIGS